MCECSNCLILCVRPAEDTFLSAIINYTNSSTVHFKLSPTYVLYMACRYVLSPTYRPDMSPSERTHKVIAIVNKMVSMMEGVIQVSDATFQTFLCVIVILNIISLIHLCVIMLLFTYFILASLLVLNFLNCVMFCLIPPSFTVFLLTATLVVVVRCVCISVSICMFLAAFSPQLPLLYQPVLLSHVCLPVSVKCSWCEACYDTT